MHCKGERQGLTQHLTNAHYDWLSRPNAFGSLKVEPCQVVTLPITIVLGCRPSSNSFMFLQRITFKSLGAAAPALAMFRCCRLDNPLTYISRFSLSLLLSVKTMSKTTYVVRKLQSTKNALYTLLTWALVASSAEFRRTRKSPQASVLVVTLHDIPARRCCAPESPIYMESSQ